MGWWHRLDRSRRIAIAIIGAAAALLWTVQWWAIGPLDFSSGPDLRSRKPDVEFITKANAAHLDQCLGQNWGGRLSLNRIRSPRIETGAQRFRNRPQHLIVDLIPAERQTTLLAYKLNDAPLDPVHHKAIEDCRAYAEGVTK